MDTKYMVQTHKLDLVHRHQFRRFIELGENVLGQPPAEERNLREERCTNPGQGPNGSSVRIPRLASRIPVKRCVNR